MNPLADPTTLIASARLLLEMKFRATIHSCALQLAQYALRLFASAASEFDR